MKLLKITQPGALEQLVPSNTKNRNYWELRKKKVGSKRALEYKIEEVEIEEEEALKLGFGVPSAKPKPKVNANDMMAQVMAQNAQLIQLLTEQKSEPKKK